MSDIPQPLNPQPQAVPAYHFQVAFGTGIVALLTGIALRKQHRFIGLTLIGLGAYWASGAKVGYPLPQA